MVSLNYDKALQPARSTGSYMSNRAYLASSPTGELTRDNYGSGRLACSYFIGVLWPMLFSKDSIRYFKLQNTDGEEFDVPYLSIPKQAAMQNLQKRSGDIDRKLDGPGKSALRRFKRHLINFGDWIVLDATEIWMLVPDGFDNSLLDSIEQIDSGDLSMLIDQVGLTGDGKLEEYHYIGENWTT